MESSKAKHLDSVEDAEARKSFRDLSEELSEILRSHGIECSAYRSPELPAFSRLPSDGQQMATKELGRYVRLCRDIMAEGGSLLSSRTFAWRAIREAGLIPPSDLFSKILDTDLVEIYDLNNIQKFRNFKFFEFCSYTIEDLYTRPWHELFVRLDETITSEIMNLLTGLITNRDKRVVKTGIGTQIIEEVDSARRYVNELDVKHLAVLYDRQDRAAAFIGIESAKQLTRA
jgi:hypothetical protein